MAHTHVQAVATPFFAAFAETAESESIGIEYPT